MQKKIILLVLLGLLLTSLTGCETDKKKVVYTVYPLGYLLEKIGGDRIEIQSLQDEVIVQRASAAADLKERVKDADLVLHIGQLEPYFQLVLPEIRSSSSILVSVIPALSPTTLSSLSKVRIIRAMHSMRLTSMKRI